MPAVPFKANAAGRHHIPRQRHRVTNWPEYDAALRQRGSLTVWFTEEAIAAWRAEPRTTRSDRPHYSALAIATGLILRAVFRLALRHTEGLIGSIVRLLGLDLAIPDHSTLMWTSPGVASAVCSARARPVAPLMSTVSPVRSRLAARPPGALRHNRAAPAQHRALPRPRCLRGWRAGCPATPETSPADPSASALRQPIVAFDCAHRRAVGIEQRQEASSAQLRR
jgi:hypothetical protein